MDEIIKRFRALDTTCVSDALDSMGIKCGLYDIKPIVGECKICGPAFTVHYVPCGVEKGTVGDFLDDVKPGEVVVLDNAGRTYCTVWGDIMSIVASKTGIEGTVIDGVCRDLPTIKKLKYPLFSKGYYMSTGKDRVEVDAVNVPVSVSGVQVCPGDIILGDDTGVIVIPKDKAEEVLKTAETIDKKERQIEEEVLKGTPLKEARIKTNYHHLQTKID